MINLLIENWIYIAAMVVMLFAIIWFTIDGAIFWGDVERASKGLPTKKYFKK